MLDLIVSVPDHSLSFYFVLQLDKGGAERPVHHNKLKPYEGRNPPKWVNKARKGLLSHKSGKQ